MAWDRNCVHVVSSRRDRGQPGPRLGRFAQPPLNAQRKDAMAATTVFPSPTGMDIRFHDRVRVPDGRTGNVVRFYRTRTEMALVVLVTGEARKFVLSELELAAHN